MRRDFAALVDRTRRRRHRSIRDLAKLAGVPATTMQGWLSGKHFPVPALRENYLRMVAELELTDQLPQELWDDRWVEVSPELRSGPTPYLGLRPFGIGDRELYFGRAAESRRLAEAVLGLRAAGHGVLVVLGPSGCGKSSLLAAGLLGHQATDGLLTGWTTELLAVTELAGAADLAAELLVVDQFEDVFAFSEDDRRAALARVASLAEQRVVVLGLRADAFALAAQEPALTQALSRPFLVAPLTREEASEVVVGPAGLAGVSVDDDLVELLLDDLATGPRPDTAAVDVLPLLSNALLVTWTAGRGDRMTLADYLAAGGVAAAVQGLAEGVYQSLDDTRQDAARRLFLRLVRLSGDILTREAVPLRDIDRAGREAMAAFVAARMLTVTDDVVRISHDALLTHWPRVGEWIGEARVDLAVVEQLRRAAQVWAASGQSPDALIPVDRLEVFSQWVRDPARQQLLSPLETRFVTASRDHFTSVLAQKEQVNARLRRGRGLAIGLTAVVSALAVTAGLLYWQGRGLQAAADEARLDAQSRQVALEARSIRSDDPSLMAQMSLIAAHLADTRQAQSALLDATSVNTPLRWLGAANAIVAKTADDQLVARANGSGEVTLWLGEELTTGPGTTFLADPAGGPLYALTLASVNGRILLAAGGGSSAGLWDVTAEPTLLADLRDAEFTTYGAAFNAAGDRLALATSTGEVALWSVPAGQPAAKLGTLTLADSTPARSVVFSPTGELFVAGPTNAVAHWAAGDTPERLPDLSFSYDNASVISQTLAISPDGRQLAAGISGRRVYRWSLAGGKATALEPLLGFQSWTNDLAFSTDGSRLLAANSDQNVYVFDAASGALLETLGGSTLVTGVELVGGRPVSAGADGALRVWQAENPVLRTGSTVYALTSDQDGHYLAASTLNDGVNLWDTAGVHPVRLPDPEIQGRTMASAVAVAPNGGFLLAGTTDGTVLSWQLGSSGTNGDPAAVAAFPGSYLGAITISPDSSLVAVVQYNGPHVALYRADPAGRLSLLSQLDSPTPQGISFSPDGGLLAVPIEGGAVQLWNLTTPSEPRPAGQIEGLASLPTSASFANSSRTLAIGTDTGQVSVWDVTEPARPVQRRSFGDPRAAVYAVAFNPDDTRLVAVGGDQLVWVWRLDQPGTEAYLALDGAMGRTNDARFINRGERLVVGGNDGTVRVWTSRLDDARRQLCENRGDVLTEEEWGRYLPGVTPQDPC